MKKLDLQEIQPYIRYINNYKPGYSYVEKERIIYDYELMYVMEGEVEMYYGGKVFSLKRGDVFYLKPFIKNYIKVDEKAGFRTHCIHFDWQTPLQEENFTAEEVYMHSVTLPEQQERLGRLWQRLTPEPEGLSIMNHMTNIPYEKLASLFAACYRFFAGKDAVSSLHVRAMFLEIVAIMADYSIGKKQSEIMHPKIIAALNDLRDNYTDKITVEGLAQKYRISPKYFGTLFKRATGKSVNQYILSLRLYDAKEMLMGTNMTMEEIAEKTGFQNVFYFSKCFKQQERVSPSVFRDMC